jgi:hypothetical protein
MTVPGIDMLFGSSGAYSCPIAGVAVGPALGPDQELSGMQEWPLRSYLKLRALPASVRSARLHAKNILHEWGMEALADTVELLVSELATNAVGASANIPGRPDENGSAASGPWMRLWLTSDGYRILIGVWDDHHRYPLRRNAGLDAEAGRGLLLVENLSTSWGCYASDEQGGKIVWALCAE